MDMIFISTAIMFFALVGLICLYAIVHFSKGKKRIKRKGGRLTCPKCSDTRFMEGPSGGGCVNIKCVGCGEEYNLTPFGIDDISGRRISRFLRKIEEE